MGVEQLCCLCSPNTKVTFTAAKWFYFGLLAWSGILTWILRDYGDNLLKRIPELDGCEVGAKENGMDLSKCYGIAAVLRISFATALFHASHLVLLIKCKYEEDQRAIFHTACHGLKFLVWLGLVIASFFMPSGFFRVYGEIARVASGLFLVFQALVIIDWFYELNEKMLDRDECRWPLMVLSTLSYSFSLTVIGVAFHFFAPRGTCSTNIFWIVWTLLLGIVVSVISLSKWRPDNAGLFTSGAVFGYCSFLLVSALNSLPSDSECISGGGMSGGWIRVSFNLIIHSAVHTQCTKLSASSWAGTQFQSV